MSHALVLMARARSTLWSERPTALRRAYCDGAAHCWRSSGLAGVEITWQSTKTKRASNRARKLLASPWSTRKGKLRQSEASTSGTGRKRENQTLHGRASTAEVTHHALWSSPASSGESWRSARIKGKNIPKL